MAKLLKSQKNDNSSISHYFPLSSTKINSSKISIAKNNLINKSRKIRYFKRIKPIKKRKKATKKNDSDNDSSETLHLGLLIPKDENKNKNKNQSESDSNQSFNFCLDNDSNDESLSFGLDIPTGKPEWMEDETEKIKNVKMRFNQEILDYIDYITPKGWLYAKREIALDNLRQMIKFYNNN